MSKGTSDYQEQLDREYQRGREDMRCEVVEWVNIMKKHCPHCKPDGSNSHDCYISHQNQVLDDLIDHLTQQL